MTFGRKKSKKNKPFFAVLALCALLTLFGTFIYEDGEKYLPASTFETESSEPFGYFRGKWNFWEFVGDSVRSLFC